MMKKFDLCFSNPPYNDGVDLKIIKIIENITEEMVIVHPSTWLIDSKCIHDPYICAKTTFNKSLKSVELFNGNPVFGIGLFAPCSITHIDKKKDPQAPIDVTYFGRNFQVNDINDITVFGPEWLTIVKPFYEKMKIIISKTGSVWDHNIKTIVKGKHYCQLAAIIGDTTYRGDQKGPNPLISINTPMWKDNLYTLVMKESDNNKGVRSNTRAPIFVFNTIKERDNFINYLKTYFVRFCLSIYKTGRDLSKNEVALIPKIDFTKEWTDEKLFAHFGIDEETQNYINKFLPDYYEFREKE